MNTVWQSGAGGDTERPNLVWPYFNNEGEMWEAHQTLEARRKEFGPEHEAKLKAARERYWAEKKARENKQ